MSTIKLVVTAAVTTSSLLGSFTAPAAGPAHELTSPAAAVAAAPAVTLKEGVAPFVPPEAPAVADKKDTGTN